VICGYVNVLNSNGSYQEMFNKSKTMRTAELVKSVAGITDAYFFIHWYRYAGGPQ
jgi:hypothetical protein